MHFLRLSFLFFGFWSLRFAVSSWYWVLLSFWPSQHSLSFTFHHIYFFHLEFFMLQEVYLGEFFILIHFCFKFHFSNVQDIFSFFVDFLTWVGFQHSKPFIPTIQSMPSIRQQPHFSKWVSNALFHDYFLEFRFNTSETNSIVFCLKMKQNGFRVSLSWDFVTVLTFLMTKQDFLTIFKDKKLIFLLWFL